MASKESKMWMEWYRNGGRERVNAQRRARHWMTKKEYEELTKQ